MKTLILALGCIFFILILVETASSLWQKLSIVFFCGFIAGIGASK
jgi:hypothetical protein